jgi:hypothetical protein
MGWGGGRRWGGSTWWEDPGLFVSLVWAVLQPPLVVGLVALGEHLNAFGAGLAQPLGVALSVIGFLSCVSVFALVAPGAAVLLSFLTLVLAVGATMGAYRDAVLQERGVTTSCAVLDVIPRTTTEFTTDANGNRTSHTETKYGHVLDCVGGRPDSVLWADRVAEVGDRLDVTYDPDDRVSPTPARLVGMSDSARTAAFVLLGVTVFVRVVGVLVEDGVFSRLRNAWRRRWTGRCG